MDEDDFLTAVADLRDLLHDIPEWRLPTADWPEVGEALRAARSALGAADTARLQDLVGLVAAIAPNDTDPHMRSWAQILQAWRGHVNRMPPAGILGEVIVLTGLYAKPVPLARSSVRALKQWTARLAKHPWRPSAPGNLSP